MPRSQTIVVIDYNGGNLASAARALVRAASDAGLPVDVHITADPVLVRNADRIVLPGQGAFADCAAGIDAVPELKAIIEQRTHDGVPFLGICVGMQLMAQRGLEHAITPGFGWISGEIALMDVPDLRLPQMGWNRLDVRAGGHPLTEGLAPDAHGYFVHSYALRGFDDADQVATTDYGGAVPAIVARGNRAGTQFHVEKSQTVGLKILANFLRWTPTP